MVDARAPVNGRSPFASVPKRPATTTALPAAFLLVIGTVPLAWALVRSPLLALLIASAAALGWAVFSRPHFGAYVLLGATPLLAGIDRGFVIPLFRPNEALAMLIGGALLARGVVAAVSWRRPPELRLRPIDVTILLMALTSSVLPLLWMAVRAETITSDDILHALVLWKYYGVYLIVRSSVTTTHQVRRCLWIVLGAASIVAIIGILQSLSLFGVPQILAKFFAPFGETEALANNRASSTLALPIAVADLLTFCLAIAAGFLGRSNKHGLLLVMLSALFILGVLASGEFSGAVALLLGGAAIALVTRRLQLLRSWGPTLLVAAFLLRPVIERRLSGFESPEGLPVSWVGRWYNLTTFFWPKLFSSYNFVLGVRPSARLATTRYLAGYVWIESGYTWLLWAGGIPFLLSFLLFLLRGLRVTAGVARRRRDAIGVAAEASFVSLVVIAVLMVLDPHLTFRGSADVLFALLALATTKDASSRRDSHDGTSARSAGPALRPSELSTASSS